jgi:hypothetical protein
MAKARKAAKVLRAMRMLIFNWVPNKLNGQAGRPAASPHYFKGSSAAAHSYPALQAVAACNRSQITAAGRLPS